MSIYLYFCGPPVAQGLQLLKILWKGNAAGLSLTSALLQLYALSCPVLDAMANNFPLLYVCKKTFASSLLVLIHWLLMLQSGSEESTVISKISNHQMLFFSTKSVENTCDKSQKAERVCDSVIITLITYMT